VQVKPIKPKLKAPKTKRLKLKYGGPLSNSAFNLRRCTKVSCTTFPRRFARRYQDAAPPPPPPPPPPASFNSRYGGGGFFGSNPGTPNKNASSSFYGEDDDAASPPPPPPEVRWCRLTLANPCWQRLELSA
jgi:hypothetical protein